MAQEDRSWDCITFNKANVSNIQKHEYSYNTYADIDYCYIKALSAERLTHSLSTISKVYNMTRNQQLKKLKDI